MLGYTSQTNIQVSFFVFLVYVIYILMKPECLDYLLTTYISMFHSLLNSRLVRFIKRKQKKYVYVFSLSASRNQTIYIDLVSFD
jgi:hypothetical protein